MRKILYLLVLFGAFSASAQRFVRYFDTVTDMAASNPADPNVYVVVGGSVSFNDNQAARWKWVSGSVDPADGNTVVSTWAGGWPGKPAGRWKKINEASGIVIDTSGFITNYNVVVVNDKASLQNINVTNNIAVALVKGKYGMNDGWEGQFTFNAASTAVADDAFYVAPNTGVGMWERQTPNPLREIPATWFDPNLTNGVIQAAINYAASLSTNAVPGREVLLPPKFIELNGNTGLNMSNNVTLVGQNGTVLATSAGTVAGYQMIRANGVTNWAVKNLQLIGLASVGGYGIYVSNSSKGLWGGISFATNFTTAPVWITNSSEIVCYDDKWVKNGVRGYGAQGDGHTIDTTAFTLAIQNSVRNGDGPVRYYSGTFPVALYITNNNVSIEGSGGALVDTTITNTTLVNASTNQYIITIGADWPGGVVNLQKGTMFRNLHMNAEAGPNGIGPGCILWQGGTYEASVYSSGFFGGWDYSLKHTAGTNQQALFIDYYSCRGQEGNYGNGLIYADSWNNNDTGARFTHCFFSGSNTNGHVIVLDGERIYMNQTWVQCANLHGILLRKSPGTVNYPGIIGEGIVDSDDSNDILVEGYDNNHLLGSFLFPHINVDGKYRLLDGTIITNGGARDFATDQTVLIYPHLWGALDMITGSTYTGPDYQVSIARSGNNVELRTGAGSIFLLPKNYVTIENTNGLPILNLLAVDTKNLLTNQVMGVPNPGDVLIINTITNTWASPVVDPAHEVLIGADANESATNLYNHFVTYPMSGGGVWRLYFDGPDKVINQAQFVDIISSHTGTWRTPTTAVKTDFFTHSIYSQDSTNMFIRSAGDLSILNTNGSAVARFMDNAKSGLVYVNSNGFGINRIISSPTSLAIDGQASLSVNPSVSISKVETNNAATTLARLEGTMQPFPYDSGATNTTNSAGIFIFGYGGVDVSPSFTNNLTGAPAMIAWRSFIRHSGPGNVSQAVGFYGNEPIIDGHGDIATYAGFLSAVYEFPRSFLSISITNVPSDGNEIAVNLITNIWRTVPSLTNEVLIGANELECATNLISHYLTNPVGSGSWNFSMANETNVTIRVYRDSITNSITGTWATLTESTNIAPIYGILALGTAPNRFNGKVGVKNDPSVSLHVNGGFATQSRNQTALIADDQVVTVGDLSYLKLASDTATATDRTIILTPGLVEGQHLIIEAVSAGANSFELIDDSALDGGVGNVRLSASWTPLRNGELFLIFNGVDWVEVSRSAN